MPGSSSEFKHMMILNPAKLKAIDRCGERKMFKYTVFQRMWFAN